MPFLSLKTCSIIYFQKVGKFGFISNNMTDYIDQFVTPTDKSPTITNQNIENVLSMKFKQKEDYGKPKRQKKIDKKKLINLTRLKIRDLYSSKTTRKNVDKNKVKNWGKVSDTHRKYV